MYSFVYATVWQLMQRIMAALKTKKHALLESPTGTGKSAAFICASLAWQACLLFGAVTVMVVVVVVLSLLLL